MENALRRAIYDMGETAGKLKGVPVSEVVILRARDDQPRCTICHESEAQEFGICTQHGFYTEERNGTNSHRRALRMP